MEILWIVLGALCMLLGLIGCILPVLPGPPISFIGLLLLQLRDEPVFTSRFLVIWALIAIGVTVLDYVVPVYGTKKMGGSKKGVWGSMIGLLLGLFLFPPIGIIVGPFVGAIVGEMMSGKQSAEAFRAGLGSFLGFLTGTLLKLIASVMMTYYFVTGLL